MYVQEVEIAKKYHVSAICAAVKSNEVSEIGHFFVSHVREDV